MGSFRVVVVNLPVFGTPPESGGEPKLLQVALRLLAVTPSPLGEGWGEVAAVMSSAVFHPDFIGSGGVNRRLTEVETPIIKQRISDKEVGTLC